MNIKQQQTTPSQELRGRDNQLGQQTRVSQTDDKQTLQPNQAQQLWDIWFSKPSIQNRLMVLGFRDA
jgi:hypothetical protein